MDKCARFFTLAVFFVFLYPASFLIGGFFPRQEFLFFCVVALAAICLAGARLAGAGKKIEGAVSLGDSWLDWGAFALCLAAFVATLASSNIHVSFFGTIDRLTGFVTFAYIGALYILIRLQFFDDHGRLRFLKAVTLALLLQALYVLAQKLSIADTRYALDGRSVGAFRNPGVAAGYLLFGVFLPLVGYFSQLKSGVRQALEKQAKRIMHGGEFSVSWKAIFLATVVASLFAVVATSTRSAFVGIMSGGLAGALCIFFDRRFSVAARRSATVFLGCALLMVSLAGIQIAFQPVESLGGIFGRLTNKADLVSGIRNRALSWSIAIDAAKERPLAGWGMDNFSEGFDKHFDTRLIQKAGAEEAWFDKAHNSFLELLATAGILGLGAYLFLIGALIRAALAMRKRSFAYVPMLSLVAAYAVNNIFIFDSLQTFTMLFVAAAWIAPEYAWQEASKKNVVFRAAGPVLGAVGALLLGVGAVYAGVLPMRALGSYDVAWTNLRAFDAQAVEGYRKSISLPGPYARDAWQYLAQLILKNPGAIGARDEQFFEGITRFAFTTFGDLSRSYRMSARDYYMAGRLGNFLRAKSDADFQKILGYLTVGSSLAPENPNFAYELAQYYRVRGDHDSALTYLNAVLAKNPHISFTYANLGFTYVEKKDFSRAIEAFERAFDIGYASWKERPEYINMFIQLYTLDEFVSEYLPRLAEFYEASIALNPNNAEHHIQLAAIYKELNDYAGARAMAESAVRLEPSLRPQADMFIRSLEAAE